MKIASWNVKSLRVRLPHVVQWLEHEQPDVLALQETKIEDERFPTDEISEAGYVAVYSGQKTYNGVAILSKEAAADVRTDLADPNDPQRRTLAATVGGVRIVDLYVPNGAQVGTEKYAYKLDWMAKMTTWLRAQLADYPDMVVLGDFNVAPDDRDVHDPAAWHERILCSTPERQALLAMLGLGLRDGFRLFDQEPGSYSWWDYRAGGFRRNIGLRIDLILLSETLRARACTIDKAPRRLERPSDHAPVIVELDL